MVAVDAVRLQPLAVVAEVVAGRADQSHITTQHADGEGDVSGHPAAMDHQVVDQEAQRHLLQVSASRCSENRPGNRIKLSVAIEPVTAIVTKFHPSFSSAAKRTHAASAVARSTAAETPR